MRFAVLLLALLAGASLGSPPAQAQVFAVREVVDGFVKTVFGAEYGGALGLGEPYMRRFERPVRAAVVDTSRKRGRKREVIGFLRWLDRRIGPLSIRVVSDPATADLRVYVVDRKDYVVTVRNEVYGSRFATVRGRCVVRSQFSRAGIARSAAVIVSDEGERLFRRCMAEEIMQALGPLNDDPSLGRSMFNDDSPYSRPQRFDLLILRMLYDPSVRSGMTLSELRPRLPALARRAMKAIPPR